jgi:pyrroline-5-carboxylate reductase
MISKEEAMTEKSVAFIGGGNMTRAIAVGLIASGYPAEKISVAEPSAEQRAALVDDLAGTTISADNSAVVRDADCVILAVKPQVLPAVCKDLADAMQTSRPLVISIAAGIRSSDIDTWLGGDLAVVRVMPNQPALLRQGVSGVFANERTSDDERAYACDVMAAVGTVVQVPSDSNIDAVTAISGSGPAYFFLLIDMLSKTGTMLGLSPETALTLAVQTASGAAALAVASDEPMDKLIERVRSPGGTTAAALDSLEDQNIRDIFTAALTAARDRAVVLADEASA